MTRSKRRRENPKQSEGKENSDEIDPSKELIPKKKKEPLFYCTDTQNPNS